MRSSAVIALAIAAAAVPALSAPFPQADYTNELLVHSPIPCDQLLTIPMNSFARDVLTERDLYELIARAEADPNNESGAFGLLGLGRLALKGAKALFGGR